VTMNSNESEEDKVSKNSKEWLKMISDIKESIYEHWNEF
jgi:hypothetical protein